MLRYSLSTVSIHSSVMVAAAHSLALLSIWAAGLRAATSAATCSVCACTATLIDCSGRSLASLTPTFLNSQLPQSATLYTEIYLYSNLLTQVSAGTFDQFTALEGLSMYSNKLTTLPDHIFDALTGLYWLTLNQNNLVSLPAGVFANQYLLESLTLSDLKLQSLSSTVFASLTHLTSLTLFNNPNLSSMPRSVFATLTSLTSLLDLQTGMTKLSCIPVKPPNLAVANYKTPAVPLCPIPTTSPRLRRKSSSLFTKQTSRHPTSRHPTLVSSTPSPRPSPTSKAIPRTWPQTRLHRTSSGVIQQTRPRTRATTSSRLVQRTASPRISAPSPGGRLTLSLVGAYSRYPINVPITAWLIAFQANVTKTTWDSSSLNQILLQFVSAVSSDLNIMGDRVVLAELDVLPNSVPCVTFAVLDRFTLSETSGDQVAQQFQSRVQTTSDALRKDSQLLQCLSTPPVQVNITLVHVMRLPDGSYTILADGTPLPVSAPLSSPVTMLDSLPIVWVAAIAIGLVLLWVCVSFALRRHKHRGGAPALGINVVASPAALSYSPGPSVDRYIPAEAVVPPPVQAPQFVVIDAAVWNDVQMRSQRFDAMSQRPSMAQRRALRQKARQTVTLATDSDDNDTIA
ncbi:unnamed protein product (mitochondrion) [Plasmodiophora brassicae]|uniref:LRRNT domain-containing protein n=1 Tax=Plasmodiophora brassicae TaxID=37360 RepID=A0A3P3Y6I5_PLABS|nr:unnamed protein product [Plasmodiophora brassicae]